MLTLATADDVLDSLLGTGAGQADPFPLYRRLHQLGPLHHSGLDGVWYVVGYEPCRQVLGEKRAGRTPEMLNHRHGVTPAQARRFEQRGRRPSMLNQHVPVHTRLRHAAREPFLPRPLGDLGPRIAEIVDERLRRLAEGSEDD